MNEERSVVIAQYFSLFEAQTSRIRLEEAGIKAELLGELTPSVFAGLGSAGGLISLLVAESDQERAQAILSENNAGADPGMDAETESDDPLSEAERMKAREGIIASRSALTPTNIVPSVSDSETIEQPTVPTNTDGSVPDAENAEKPPHPTTSDRGKYWTCSRCKGRILAGWESCPTCGGSALEIEQNEEVGTAEELRSEARDESPLVDEEILGELAYDSANQGATRAFRLTIFGLMFFFCFGIPQLLALAVALKVLLSDQPLSKKGRVRLYMALAINLLLMLTWIVLFIILRE